MKNAFLFFALTAFVFAASAQSIYVQKPGGDNAEQLASSGDLKTADGESLAKLWEETVREFNKDYPVLLGDSIKLEMVVDEEGAVNFVLKQGSSAKLNEMVRSRISQQSFTTQSFEAGTYFMWIPVNREVPEHKSTKTMNFVPLIDDCAEADNKVFRRACYEYYFDRRVREIQDTITRILTGKPDFYGPASLKVVVDKNYNPIYFSHHTNSFNSVLNDEVARLALQFKINDHGQFDEKMNGNLVYHIDVRVSDPENYGGENAVLKKADEYLENKQYREALYFYDFAIRLSKESGCEVHKKKGISNYYLGDTAQAKMNWHECFSLEERKGKKLTFTIEEHNVELAFVDVKPKEEKSTTEGSETFSFAVVESKPVYKDCQKGKTEEERFECFQLKLMQHVASTFKYPGEARKAGIQGRVFVNFVIEKDGSISSVEIVRGVHPLLDIESLRVVSMIPKMHSPAMQRGKSVRMQYTIPINARLQ